jgi:hypothetical protein
MENRNLNNYVLLYDMLIYYYNFYGNNFISNCPSSNLQK